MSDHPHISNGQRERPPDLVRIAIVDESLQDHGAIARLEVTQAMLESKLVDSLPRRLVVVRQHCGRLLGDAPLPHLATAQVHGGVAAGAEDVRIQPRRLLDPAVAKRLQHREEYVLDQVLGGRFVTQMTQAVSPDPARVPGAHRALVLGLHDGRF